MRSVHFRRRNYILLVSSLYFLLAGPLSAENSGQKAYLDKEVFLVERGEMGKKSEGKDTYVFLDGNFRSNYYEKKYGFEPGEYTAAKKGDTITFSAETRSTSNGTIYWEGTVDGHEIDVRYIWEGKPAKWFQSKKPNPSEYWARSVTTWPTEDPGPPGGAPPSNLLDGKIFLVESGEQGKEASHHEDYLVFRDGTFISTECGEMLNYRESGYSAKREGDEIHFQAQSTSPEHGVMIWEGTVRGDTMGATARWIDKRWYWTIDRMYWFRGKLVQ